MTYDSAGRVTTDRKQDDSSRLAFQTFAWTKSGALASQITPSGMTLGATFGGSGNSDNERVQTIWRQSSSDPVIDDVTWYPFGGLESYRHQNTISSHQLQTVISRDLAGRVTEVLVEDSVSGTDVFHVALTRDDKGRVTVRDGTGGHSGLQDSYFTYDLLDRLLCESASSGSCPTSGSSLKNNISGSPPYSASSGRLEFRHPIAGYSATLHEVTYVSGANRIDNVDQPSAYGQTDFGYNDKGDRLWDTNYGYDEREYGYDDRRNLVSVNGFFKPTSISSWHSYNLSNTFDQRGRRVSKTFYDVTANQLAVWYFYYDPTQRLVEIQYWPDSSVSYVYSVFQISWLSSRPVALFQTDYPSGTLSRRYIHNDETGRPLEMYSWLGSGDAARVWAVNPDGWGNDVVVAGASVFQPFTLAGKYRDDETVA